MLSKIFPGKQKSDNMVLVRRPVIMYGVEAKCFPSLEPLVGIERRILRKIYGRKKNKDEYRHRPIEELYRDLEDLKTAFAGKGCDSLDICFV